MDPHGKATPTLAMKRTSPKSTRAGILLPAIGTLAACLFTFVLAEIPSWWNDRGLVKKNAAGLAVDASDFAAANQERGTDNMKAGGAGEH